MGSAWRGQSHVASTGVAQRLGARTFWSLAHSHGHGLWYWWQVVSASCQLGLLSEYLQGPFYVAGDGIPRSKIPRKPEKVVLPFMIYPWKSHGITLLLSQAYSEAKGKNKDTTPPLHTHTSVPIVRRAWEMRHVDGVISGKYNLPQGTWDLCRLFLPTTRIVSVCVHVCVRWLFFSFTLPTSMGSLLPRVWPWKKLLTSNISGSVTSWVVSAFI